MRILRRGTPRAAAWPLRWFKGKSPTIEGDAYFLFFLLGKHHSATANDANRAKNDAKRPENAAKRVDAVLFDYGQVLSGPPDPAAWAVLRAVSGLDEERLHAAYWKFRHDYDRGALTGRSYWDAVAADAGVRFDAAQSGCADGGGHRPVVPAQPADGGVGRAVAAGGGADRDSIEHRRRDRRGSGGAAAVAGRIRPLRLVACDANGKARSGDLPEDRRGAEDRAGQDSVYRRPRRERCRRGEG